MPSFSKNYEATGERSKSYDIWRKNLKSLPSNTYTSLTYIDYTRLPHARVGTDWPIFELQCLLYPDVLSENVQLSPAKMKLLLESGAFDVELYKRLASSIGIPFYITVADYEMNNFLVYEATREGKRTARKYTAQRFAENVINQEWDYDSRKATGYRGDNGLLRYGAWHRYALSNRAYHIDIDFVELRANSPVAVIEATQSNSHDLRKAFFDFMTRGFPQEAVLVQVSEGLSVPCFIIAYLKDMSQLFVVQLNRDIVVMSDPLNRRRSELSKGFERQGDQRRIAQGKACSILYEEGEDLLNDMLGTTWSQHFELGKYQEWLENL